MHNVIKSWSEGVISHSFSTFVSLGGPVAMMRGAAMYGGFTYVLNSAFKPRQFQYKEEIVEF